MRSILSPTSVIAIIISLMLMLQMYLGFDAMQLISRRSIFHLPPGLSLSHRFFSGAIRFLQYLTTLLKYGNRWRFHYAESC